MPKKMTKEEIQKLEQLNKRLFGEVEEQTSMDTNLDSHLDYYFSTTYNNYNNLRKHDSYTAEVFFDKAFKDKSKSLLVTALNRNLQNRLNGKDLDRTSGQVAKDFTEYMTEVKSF